jgi:hypothetical protein
MGLLLGLRRLASGFGFVDLIAINSIMRATMNNILVLFNKTVGQSRLCFAAFVLDALHPRQRLGIATRSDVLIPRRIAFRCLKVKSARSRNTSRRLLLGTDFARSVSSGHGLRVIDLSSAKLAWVGYVRRRADHFKFRIIPPLRRSLKLHTALLR